MPAERTCPRCGTALSPDALEGLCATCVGRVAFAEDPAEEAGKSAFSAEIEGEWSRGKHEEAGEHLGNYKLIEQIGQGGFGTVWVAEQERPVRRRVALKIIKLGMDTKEVIARFAQERQALALMDHPNIAKVFDAGASQWGRPFFVMELVRGIRITDYCDQVSLPTAERLALFIAVCQAVQHAHQKGIIHRDLKPSNILVTMHDGVPVPKIIDFGVAKAIQQERLTELTLHTQFAQMIGTPLYMSPEQAEMSGLDIDTRSDIYSLGVLLYELLTGRTPFDPEELMRKAHDEIRRVIREQEPQTPSLFVHTMAADLRTNVAQRRQSDPAKLSGLLRGDLDWIVMKALEKDRTRRYETANGLAMDIQRHLANELVLARPPSRLYRVRRLVRRNRVVFAAAGAVAAALVIGFGFSTWSYLRAQAALRDLAGTAPEFVARARELFREEKFDEAIRKIDFAIRLDPARPEYLIAKADLLEASLQFEEARVVYGKVLALEPANARAVRHQKLCEELRNEQKRDGTLAPQSLSKLIETLASEGRSAAEQLPASRLLGAQSQPFHQLWLERLRVFPASGMPMSERLRLLPNGSFELDLSGLPVSDLSPLAGMPLEALDLSRTYIADVGKLQALAGTRLRKLYLAHTRVKDLAPLKGLPIEWLDISFTGIVNLEPLREMPLRVLRARACPIANLAALAAAPIEELHLGNATCTSLSPLAGAPLRELILENVPITDLSALAETRLEVLDLSAIPIRDLSPLARLPLKKLALRRAPVPASLRPLAACTRLEDLIASPGSDGFAELRTLPALMRISDSQEEGWPEAPAAEFWKRWEPLNAMLERIRPHLGERMLPGGFESDSVRSASRSRPMVQLNRDNTFDVVLSNAGLDDIEFLRDLPLRELMLDDNPIRDLSPLSGMKLRMLDIVRTNVGDLSPLRGMPLEELRAGFTKVRELAPLRGMQLRTLGLWNTQISDLAPLAGMPLEMISLSETRVRDLSTLRGMPLHTIHLNDCDDLRDLSPLMDCPALREIVLPPQPSDYSAFRRHAAVRYISFNFDFNAMLPAQTVEAFWAGVDEGLDPKAVAHKLTAAYEAAEFITVRARPDGTLEVDLANRPISDLAPLAGLKITSLNLDYTRVSDLSPLRGTQLRELSAVGTPVTDLAPLAGLPLTRLNIRNTKVSDLEQLRDAPLKILDVASTAVRDLAPLAGMPLEAATLETTEVTDLSPLAECTELTMVNISATAVGDLEPLRGRKLRAIYLGYSKVRDLSVLAGMPLETVFFDGTEVTNLTPLLQCPTLGHVVLPAGAHNVGALRALPKLRAISYKYKPGEPDNTAAEFWTEFTVRDAMRQAAEGHYEEAEAALTEALEATRTTAGARRPQTLPLLADLATCCVWHGHFAKAVPLFRERIAIRSKSPPSQARVEDLLDWFYLAEALVAAGDGAGYQAMCTEMLARFQAGMDANTAERLLKICSFAPGSGVSEAEIRALVETAQPAEGLRRPQWLWIARGMAEYRAGRWQTATAFLEEIDDRSGASRTALRHVLLAMTYQRQNRTAEAHARLELARTAVAALWPPRKLEQWDDEFAAYLLLQEAEALIALPPQK